MKKFIYKTVLFSLGVLILGQISRHIVTLPYHWGNPWYSSKIEFLENEKLKSLPTVYFFGSSRVHRQIDPKRFDLTIAQLSNKKVTSFNLGAPATFCPQSYYLYENFIDSKLAANTKYVFIELMNIELINESLMHQARTIYWQNLNDFSFVMDAVYSNPTLDWMHKIGYSLRYSISFLENQLGIGFLGQVIVKKTDNREEYVGPYFNGYYPLEDELLATEDLVIKEDLVKRKVSLRNDTVMLKDMASSSVTDFQLHSDLIDSVHFKRIMGLIKMSNDKNITLILFLSPRNSSASLVNLYKSIPSENKMELSDASRFPQLYTKENTFDIDHLNSNGSSIYSIMFAEEFYKVLSE